MSEKAYTESIPPGLDLIKEGHFQLLGDLGVLAQGSLGREIPDDEAVEVLGQAAAMRVPVTRRLSATCMDGRPAARMLAYDQNHGESKAGLDMVTVRNKMAGGTAVSGFLGEDWSRTYRQRDRDCFINPDVDVIPSRFQAWATENNGQLGFHVGSHTHGEGCGCGMCDNAPDVAKLILDDEYAHNRAGQLVPVVTSLMRGPFRDEVHKGLLQDTAEFWIQTGGSNTVSPRWTGKRVLETIRSVSTPDAFEKNVEVTAGEHEEVLGVVNFSNRTLHRDAFVDRYKAQVFWIDEPALLREAFRQATNPDNMDEVHARYQVMMTANVAGAARLVSSTLKFATLGAKSEFRLPKAA